MGKTRYRKIVDFLDKLKMEKGEMVKPEIFQAGIIMYLGDDSRTRKSAITLMKDFGLIKETEDGILIK